jgi:hypothetical protein
MRRGLHAAALATAVVAAACGNSSPPGPGSVVQSYLNALGEGNYASACGLLASSTRASLENRTGRHVGCPTVFARCLPNEATAFARDQTQQLYANIEFGYLGKGGSAAVTGTAVAKTVKRVTLREVRGTWRLTSPGATLEHCRR